MNQPDEEFHHHIELTVQDLITEGMTPEDARREALRRFGSIPHYRRECQRAGSSGMKMPWRTTMFATLLQDVKYAMRSFRRQPGFLFTTATTLAVGIGASTVIFSVVDTVVFRPLPYADADRLVQIGTIYGGRDRVSSSSPMNLFDWRDRNDVLDMLVGSRLQSLTRTGDGNPESISAAGVSAGFFELLGRGPFMGRGVGAADDKPAGNRVVVLSYGAWQRRWGGAPDVLGRMVRLSGQEFEIVGVMPASFHPPEAIYHGNVEMWFPLAFVDDDLTSRDNGFLQALGRLKAETTIEQARQSLNTLQRNIYAELGTDNARLSERRASQSVGVEWLHEQTIGAARGNLVVFLGAVGFLLLIACANVGNLFLVRAVGRDREIALRKALGAGKGRIARQMLTEGVVAAFLGGGAGVVVAVVGVRLFRLLAPESIPRVAEIAVDFRVLLFAVIVSLITGLLFGSAPATRYRRSDVNEALKEGALSISSGRQQNVLRHSLVVFETAVALVLLVGAGLLINSFVRRATTNPGFDPHGVARMAVFLENYESAEQRAGFFDRLVTEIQAIPGVSSAAATDNLPMTRNRSSTTITIDGRTSHESDPPSVFINRVTEGFFETLRIPITTGRAFQRADAGEAVAIVNQAMADIYWNDGDASGGRFKFGAADVPGPWVTVIGVAPEIHQMGLGEAAGPSLYLHHTRSPFVFGNVIARTEGDVSTTVVALRRALQNVDPNMPIEAIGALTDQMRATITEPRFYTWLLGSFALVALALAAIGIYGTVSYSVSRRRHEIGIRVALGAARHDVRTLVLRQGMSIAMLGLGIGMVAAVGLSRVLSGLVFDIGTMDVPTIASVSVMLAMVAGIATWFPARRAARVEPMETLRTD